MPPNGSLPSHLPNKWQMQLWCKHQNYLPHQSQHPLLGCNIKTPLPILLRNTFKHTAFRLHIMQRTPQKGKKHLNCYSISHSSILLVTVEKLIPNLKIFLESLTNGLQYPLLSICSRASLAEPSIFNSIT